MSNRTPPTTLRVLVIGALALQLAPAFADVTVEEQSSLNVSALKALGAFKVHSTRIEQIAGDKQRSETSSSCDGMLNLLCKRNASVEIVRLDRNLTWTVEPKKKRFTESPFPTPEQRQAMQEHMRAVAERLKSCPQAAVVPAMDPSKCQMSAPTVAVERTDEVATIVGQEARRTNVVMTQSCKNKDTGDVCDFTFTMSQWLTSNELPGHTERQSFQKDYVRKLGLISTTDGTPAQIGPYLAPYADSLKKLGDKTSGLKGYPLKTAFRIAYGGAHCALAQSTAAPDTKPDGTITEAGKAGADAAANASGNAARWGTADAVHKSTGGGLTGYVAGTAAGAFAGNLVSGLFSKKKKPDDAAKPASAAGAAGTDPSMTTIAEITIETTSFSTAPVAATQFEVPDGWKKITPQDSGEMSMPDCPKTEK